MPINQDQFWGSNAKVCVTYPIHANLAILINDFQQKYVVLKAMRRFGGISKNSLIRKLKSKVYVSFLICLYLSTDSTITDSMICAGYQGMYKWAFFYIRF